MDEKSQAKRGSRIRTVVWLCLLGLGGFGFLYAMWAFGAFNFPPLPSPLAKIKGNGRSVHHSGSSVLVLTSSGNTRPSQDTLLLWPEMHTGRVEQIERDSWLNRLGATGQEEKVFVMDFSERDDRRTAEQLLIIDFSEGFSSEAVPDVYSIVSHSDTMHEVLIEHDGEYFRISLGAEGIERTAVLEEDDEHWIFPSMIEEYELGNAVLCYTEDYFIIAESSRVRGGTLSHGDVRIADAAGQRELAHFGRYARIARVSDEHNVLVIVSEVGWMYFFDATTMELLKERDLSRPRGVRVWDVAFTEDRGSYYTIDTGGHLRLRKRLHR